jgi:hypothetical protein
MPGPFLTTASTVMCPHGGQAALTTANSKMTVAGSPVLLESDVHPVAGCAFQLPGPTPSPCVRIQWSAGATSAGVNGTAPLVQSSVGQCCAATGAVQGVAIVTAGQGQGTGR